MFSILRSMFLNSRALLCLLVLVGLFACTQESTQIFSPGPDPEPEPEPVGDPFDVPIDGVNKEQVALFNAGDELFGLPLREGDGLGPLYTQTSCGGCHD